MKNPFQKWWLGGTKQPLLKNLLMMTAGGTVLLALLVLVGIWRTGERFFDRVSELFVGPPSTPKVDVRSIVIRQVRGASELTTAVFAMEAVVPTRHDRTLGRLVVGTTTLLYIARGEVRAGVDLKDLTPSDVEIASDTLQIRLPPPRILDSKIDVNQSSVYDYDRGFLGLGPDTAPQLQQYAEKEALKKIVAAACTEGLLKEANDRAQLVVTQLLNTAGYKSVEVKTQSPSPNGCLQTPASAEDNREIRELSKPETGNRKSE